MVGHGEKLTRKQEALIGALLNEDTIDAAAKTVGIGIMTAYRWLKDPGFRAVYREARREVVEHAITHVQQATGEAVQTLRDVMGDVMAPASARVSASRTVLDLAIKVVEVQDLEARIAALESQKENTLG
jgi:predicted site-specific integrase-resolvase